MGTITMKNDLNAAISSSTPYTSESVQAFVLNHSYQSSFDRITDRISVTENLLDAIENENGFVDGWSAPRWAGIGDIAFFMLAKTTGQVLARHQKFLYDLGTGNMSYKHFIKILPSLCKYENDPSEKDYIMIFPEEDVDTKDYGTGETLIVENVSELTDRFTYVSINHSAEHTIMGYESFKQFVFDHSDRIRYYWTDYKLAIPVIKELVINRRFNEKFGGKIFAVGKVCSIPQIEKEESEQVHWRTPIYAQYDNVSLLEEPIDISEFRDFITISRQGTVTPVYGEAFDQLRDIIVRKNGELPLIKNVSAYPISLSNMNDDNWIEVAGSFRRRFILESQFRVYYVDRLLRLLSGGRNNIFRECICYNSIRNSRPRVDNVILLNGLYLPVEVKLNVRIENDIKRQCSSYCHVDKCDLNTAKSISGNEMLQKVLVIDTSFIYLYDGDTDKIETIKDLDSFVSSEDIKAFRAELISRIQG